MNAARQILAVAVARHPDKPALIFQGEAISYADLYKAACGFARMLQARGVAPHDSVGLCLPDCPAFITAFLGIMLCGAVPIPIGLTLSEVDKAFILDDAKAVLLVALASGAPKSDGAVLLCDFWGPIGEGGESATAHDVTAHSTAFQAYRAGEEDVAFMLYTSGSTGRPKGVPHRHEDLLTPSVTLGPALCGDLSADILLSASKLSFSYGLMAQVGLGLAGGATVILHPGVSDTEALAELLCTYHPTVLFAAPTGYAMLLRALDAEADISSLRLCISSGEAMPASLHAIWQERFGLGIVEVLGSTEVFTSYMATVPGHDSPGTLGHPVPGFVVRVVDEAGDPVGDGEQGRLLVRGPGITRGYWNRAEQAAAMFFEGDWFETGDLCIRQGGALRYLGRRDDLFRTAGQWVAPLRVEECLLGHPAVAQCAVAACDVRGMTYPFAFVVSSYSAPDMALGGELIRYAKAQLPRHMCPVQVLFLKDLPRTATGKVQRHKLRM